MVLFYDIEKGKHYLSGLDDERVILQHQHDWGVAYLYSSGNYGVLRDFVEAKSYPMDAWKGDET